MLLSKVFCFRTASLGGSGLMKILQDSWRSIFGFGRFIWQKSAFSVHIFKMNLAKKVHTKFELESESQWKSLNISTNEFFQWCYIEWKFWKFSLNLTHWFKFRVCGFSSKRLDSRGYRMEWEVLLNIAKVSQQEQDSLSSRQPAAVLQRSCSCVSTSEMTSVSPTGSAGLQQF